MVQQKLIVGRYLHFAYPTWPGPAPVLNVGAFLTQPAILLQIEESTGVFTKQSNIIVGQHAAKARRNFQWLCWAPGMISEVDMQNGPDVLTGPMSGCDLVLYERNGVKCAGHLGTDVGADANNTAIKLTWNNFANGHVHDMIGGFNPVRDYPGNYPTAQGDDVGGPIFFGVYTTANELYSLVLFSQRMSKTNKNAHPTKRRIAALERIQPKVMPLLGQL